MRFGRSAALLALTLPGAAGAQALSCAPPASVPKVRPELPSDVRQLPVGSYTLAISWSPEYCRRRSDAPAARFQCGGRNRFGFVLHGLWADGHGAQWPQYCRPASLLPPPLIRRNLCATPSPQLQQHEWAKHGTCMPGYTPERYFARSTGMFGGLRYPDMDALSRRSTLTAGALAIAIAAANRGMRADMMRVTTTRGGWLDEVWLCADTRFRYVACPAHQQGADRRTPIRIWRGS